MSTDQTTADGLVDTRHREMAIEHILFGAVRFVAARHPEMLDEIDASLAHLWDRASDGPRDDEAVREIARRFLKSLRNEAHSS